MFQKTISKPILIASVVFGLSLCFIAVIFQVFVFPNITIENETKFRVDITPLPDFLKTGDLSIMNNAAEIQTKTPPLPGVFAIGMVIEIYGTQNEGLNIRQTAGTDSPVVYLAHESEVYTIINGPEIKDGLIWWNISLLPDGQKIGWAVQDYFAPPD